MLKKFSVSILSLVCLALLAQSAVAAASQYRKIDAKGMANMIFSTSAIGLGQEDQAELKETFEQGDPIYGRVYFPKPFGALRPGEKVHYDLWIDDQFVARTLLGTINPAWDTIQLYLIGTGNDNFDSSYFESLPTGEHKFRLYLVRDKFLKTKKTLQDGVRVQEDVYVPVYLSEGKINYVIP